MDARMTRALLLVAVLVISMGAKRATPNFIVETADPNACEQLAKAAERYREELAIAWLGAKMPDWSTPCPMHVQVGPHLGAGGATTFVFDRGEVYGWRMNIQGSLDRLLDSVVPHEVTHMIYASHFRRPLPRWADEGGATSVEATAEKTKHRKMLVQFLQTNRGIAFNTMFAMTEYPQDVMPLYAQGYSLAEYLIEQGGRRKYMAFLGEGMQTNQWGAAVAHHYSMQDLGVLQNTWLGWVSQGSPRLTPAAGALAAATPLATPHRPEPNLILRLNKDGSAVAARPQGDSAGPFNSGWRPADSADAPQPAQLNRVDPRAEVLRR